MQTQHGSMGGGGTREPAESTACFTGSSFPSLQDYRSVQITAELHVSS